MRAGAAAVTAALAGCATDPAESTPPTRIDSWPPDVGSGPLVTRTYYPAWIEWADEAFADATDVRLRAEGQPFAWQDRRPFDDGVIGDLRRWWANTQQSNYEGPRRRVDVVSLQDWRLHSARDLLHPLPVDRMPRWETLRPRFRDIDFHRDDDGVRGVPIEGTIAGLTYDTERFDAPPDSWELLFDSEFSGRAVCTDPLRFPHVAAQYLGQDPRSPDDVDAIRAVLETHRDRLVEQSAGDESAAVDDFFVTDAEAVEAFASGRAVLGSVGMAPMYAARFGRGLPIDYTAPREGALFSAFFLGVPAEAPNPLAATRFVDWALSPTSAAELSARERFMPTVDLRGTVPDAVASFFEWPDEWSLRYDDPRTTDDVETAYSEVLSDVYGLF
jgi:ABC-type Fe3+ transport system substrate-binding protein